MTDYAVSVRKHRRLAILRALEVLPEYTSNSSMLQEIVNDVGIRSSRDQITTEIAWLAEQGFARADGAEFVVVTATQRGVEVARGIASHPDVQRPGPRD